MKTFEKIYEHCRDKSSNKPKSKKIKEVSYSELSIRDELVSDLEAAMIDILVEYKTMDLTRDQVIECVDEACCNVKINPEIRNY